MRGVWLVFRREMLGYFVSPVAYAILIAFFAIAGWYYYVLLTGFVDLVNKATDQAMMLQQGPLFFNVTLGVMGRWFSVTGQLLLFLSPLITMRLLAEERGSGRIDLLLSAPLTDAQLVAGKFLAGVAMCGIILLPTALYPALLFHFGNPELAPILSGYLGILLLSVAVVGLGLAVSALTSSQVVSAAASFGLVLFFWLLGAVSHGEASGWRAVLSYASLLGHFTDFSNGVIDTRNVIYFLSFAAFTLFVTLRAVESQRWRG